MTRYQAKIFNNLEVIHFIHSVETTFLTLLVGKELSFKIEVCDDDELLTEFEMSLD
jgi:hypothetical protein